MLSPFAHTCVCADAPTVPALSCGTCTYNEPANLPCPMMHLSQPTNLTNHTVHLSHIPHYTIQNRNVHISVLNGVLWDMGQVHCVVCEIGLLAITWQGRYMSVMVSQTPVIRLFVEQLVGSVTDVFPSQRSSNTESNLCHDVIMTSSWKEEQNCNSSVLGSNSSQLVGHPKQILKIFLNLASVRCVGNFMYTSAMLFNKLNVLKRHNRKYCEETHDLN